MGSTIPRAGPEQMERRKRAEQQCAFLSASQLDCLMLLPPYSVTTGCALRPESSRRAFPHTDFVRDAVTALRKVTDGHRTKEGEDKRRILTSTPRLKAPHSRASFL